jgi:hypothetical protein
MESTGRLVQVLWGRAQGIGPEVRGVEAVPVRMAPLLQACLPIPSTLVEIRGPGGAMKLVVAQPDTTAARVREVLCGLDGNEGSVARR